jgi:Protein of unknown function (DUF1549)/Protein of unknown function (DUF1553)
MTLRPLFPLVPLGVAIVVGACQGTTPPMPSQDATSQAPVAPPPPPAAFGPATIDAALRAEWAKLGVTPAPRVDDAGFLRRAYLDIVGTVPPPSVVTSFLADTSTDKRAKLVDHLLASPAYALYWATTWEDILVGWRTREQLVDRGALRDWLAGELAANTSWDKIVTALMTAKGQNSRGGKRQDGAPAPIGEPSTDASTDDEHTPINGAVNWFLKYRDTPQDLAGNASRIFLGVQIQCAQCHDHKTEKWKQDDFRRFAACFARTKSEPLDQGKVMGLRRSVVVDLDRPLPRFAKNADLGPIAQARPTALDGTDLSASGDVRAALAAWMTAKDNPWFAKAIVNRMWGHFLGRGFVDPVDDLRDSNFTAMPDVFADLAKDFTAHGDDIKALIRTITATEAYQLAAERHAKLVGASPAEAAMKESNAEQYWARFHVTPLGPNELIRSILDATDLESFLTANTQANVERVRFQIYERYSFLFDVDEDAEQSDFEGTVAQALSLLNGALVGGGTSSVPEGALDRILAAPGSDADKVTALYLRTVSRPPSADELAYWTQYVAEPHAVERPAQPPPPAPLPPPPLKKNGKPVKPGKGAKPPGPDVLTRLEMRDLNAHPDSRRQAYVDLFWALLNSSEFTFNH